MNKIALIILICGVFVNISYAQQITKEDPFEQLVPIQEVKAGESMTVKTANVNPPSITVQGILWGTDTPQAIIDGEVYKTGDSLKGMDGKVYKIEKDSVFIFYSGRLFEMSSGKKEAK